MAARVILLHHVLRAIPIYHLMAISLNSTGFADMEKICARFLWGTNTSNGKHKKALVAWEVITTDKNRGGLGFSPFLEQAHASRMRHVSKILNGENKEWIVMAKQTVMRELRRGKNKKERKQWGVEEALLLEDNLVVSNSLVVKNLLQGWALQWRKLSFEFCQNSLPKHLSCYQVMLLYRRHVELTEDQARETTRFLANKGICYLKDLRSREGDWISFETLDERTKSTRGAGRIEAEDFVRVISSTGQQYRGRLLDGPGWAWPWAGKNKGWKFRNKVWKENIQTSISSLAKLERRWMCTDSEERWKSRWQNLWRSNNHGRCKLVVWRILQHSYFNYGRA